MSLLSGIGKKRLAGHKDLSKNQAIIACDVPDLIYIPLVDGNATDFDVYVKEGDHVSIGTKLAARKGLYVPLYASVSGTVKGIEKRMHATKRPQNHIVIENDHQEESIKVLTIEKPDEMSKEEVFEAIKELGLVGLGGSGFPTFMKYKDVQNIDTILINGVECEPYITSDHLEMKREVKALFDGVHFMMIASGAAQGLIAIKEHKPDLMDLLKEEAKNYKNIMPVEVEDAYPMGWERLLVKTVTKRDYDVLPSEAGVIVNNSTTAIALSHGIREGKPIVSRLVTISGENANHPCNVDVRVGTPAHDVIEAAGGAKEEGEGLVIAGGPMMGKSIMNDTFVISSYMNALTLLPFKEDKSVACMKCGECTLHCPMHLQPVRIMQAEKAANEDLLGKLEVARCVECGMCSYVCPSKVEVTDFVQKGKRRYTLFAKRRV